MADSINFITVFLKYVSWWLLPIIILLLYKRALSKYPIDVIIYEKRGENVIKTNDVAGRTDNPVHGYTLKTTKDTIPIPDYDWVLQCMHKPTNFLEKFSNLLSGKIGSITLFKYSSKQYKPVKVAIDARNTKIVWKEIRDAQGNPVYIQVYEPVNVKQSMSNLTFEVIDWDDINHMTQELRAIALRRSPLQSFIEKWGHWIAFGLAVMVLIIAGYYYKEMIIDAGAKAQSMNGASSGVVNAPNASAPNIPLIGDLINN